MRKEEAMKLEQAIERCFNRCNLEGEDCDIYSQMYRYKAIRELDEEEFEEVYDYLAKRLGFTW